MADKSNPDIHRFHHAAMATEFEAVIAGRDQPYARQAAQAAFALVDRIEESLSCYIPSSDISRLNQSARGEPVRVTKYTLECIEAAARVYDDTGGAFDITVGPLMACWRDADGNLRRPSEAEQAAARARVGMQHVVVDKETSSVTLNTDGMSLDLGGIGKGYALDKAALLLAEWGVSTALLSVGSTVLALDAPSEQKNGWPLGVGGADPQKGPYGKIALENMALSGSGTMLKGRHIFNPRTGKPAYGKRGSWVVCPAATTADALSTAFMVLSKPEVEAYCNRHKNTYGMLLIEHAGSTRYVKFGEWEKELKFERSPDTHE